MKYDFDKIIDRMGTNSVKWEFMNQMFEDTDLLPLWVADMDFECPPQVIEAIKARANHGIYGYSSCDTESYAKAVIGWMKRRHNWDIKREWILQSPGVVPALSMALQTFTQPGDKVIIQRPVYYPFTNVIINNGREVLNNPLVLRDGRYYIDFEDLEEKAKDPLAKLMFLCSPHNPVGRVWTREELERIGNICLENNIILVSDEIHGDLILFGNKHTPMTSINPKFWENTIVCTAPSKTFNIAGLHNSNIIIANENLRTNFARTLVDKNGLNSPTPFAIVATEAAYNHGEEWLDEVLKYIESNVKFVEDFCREKMPKVKLIKPEGTYLIWLDFRELGLSKEELTKLIIKDAKVALDEGYIFGDEGTGFQRINVGCPRSILEDCMNRILSAISSY